MINSITAGSGITVNGGYSTIPNVTLGVANAGAVHYNAQIQELQVFTGSQWVSVSSHTQIELAPSVQLVVNWAMKKMADEDSLDELLEKHPGLRDTYEKFELMKALCNKDKDNVSR